MNVIGNVHVHVSHVRGIFTLLQAHKVRETFVTALEKQFPDIGLKYSIGTWVWSKSLWV